MKKSDQSIHHICIAAIKRSTIKPYDFKWTQFYETETDITKLYQGIPFEQNENELVICSTIIDNNNFSIVTTQKIVTMENGVISAGEIKEAKNKLYGDFKGINKEPVTFGKVGLKDGSELKYFIETGNASMVMIHGVRTAINIK